MDLRSACLGIMDQLSEIIAQLNEQQFTAPVKLLNQATIGQHIRHTLEFFLCLSKGCEDGIVDYDNRGHDKTIENNRLIALASIDNIKNFIDSAEDSQMLLKMNYAPSSNDPITITTSYLRELAYNIEHAIHHMAIIKIGLQSICPDVTIPKEFGVAVSTLRYQQELQEKVRS